jgi:ABC-2 type transport system ATP-binding protein
MSVDKIAIRVSDVSKDFVLPHEKATSIKSLFTGIVRSKHNAETQHALKNVSFEIKKGEFFGIVGRNGSGKSTMLKILAGIYQPSSGTVETEGKLVPFIELGVGFNPELTGRENVYLNGAMLGFSQKEVESMYDDIVAFAELERFMDQKLKNYSSGMQVRLAFSMATRANADILLIDEVLAVGDADFQRKCFDYFHNLKKEKRTVVFVSHDMDAVREYCDKAILIDSNEVKFRGTAEDVAQEYLKLFNEENIGSVSERNENCSERWGDGAAKYEELSVKVSGSIVSVDASIIVNKEVMNNPILGIQISDSEGRSICGTNNKIIRKKVGSIASGDKISVRWEVPNIFSTGTYSIDLAVTYPDGITQADWWHRAETFHIVNPSSTPHLASPNITLAITR